jgi:23S rRNA pseudouridine2605 synthase
LDERLHKLLAQHGIGSRRQVEDWIREGRVLVNGAPAAIGQRVGPRDRVVVDGRDVTRRLAGGQATRVLLYHKPGGEMLRTRAGDDRAGVEAHLPSVRSGRWVPVNALGYGEEGLLVLTSDGTLSAAIGRVREGLPVEYRARVLRPHLEERWPPMPVTIDVEGEPVAFTSIERLDGAGTNFWFRVASDAPLPRGAIRALFDSVGLKLSRTLLVRWGPVALPRDLPRGRSRELTGAELDAVLELAGRTRTRPAAARKSARRRPTGRPPGRRSGGR